MYITKPVPLTVKAPGQISGALAQRSSIGPLVRVLSVRFFITLIGPARAGFFGPGRTVLGAPQLYPKAGLLGNKINAKETFLYLRDKSYTYTVGD